MKTRSYFLFTVSGQILWASLCGVLLACWIAADVNSIFTRLLLLVSKTAAVRQTNEEQRLRLLGPISLWSAAEGGAWNIYARFRLMLKYGSPPYSSLQLLPTVHSIVSLMYKNLLYCHWVEVKKRISRRGLTPGERLADEECHWTLIFMKWNERIQAVLLTPVTSHRIGINGVLHSDGLCKSVS